MTAIVRLHLPHTVPAPHASATAPTDAAPSSMTSRMVVLVTASQRQIHTGRDRSAARSGDA